MTEQKYTVFQKIVIGLAHGMTVDVKNGLFPECSLDFPRAQSPVQNSCVVTLWTSGRSAGEMLWLLRRMKNGVVTFARECQGSTVRVTGWIVSAMRSEEPAPVGVCFDPTDALDMVAVQVEMRLTGPLAAV